MSWHGGRLRTALAARVVANRLGPSSIQRARHMPLIIAVIVVVLAPLIATVLYKRHLAEAADRGEMDIKVDGAWEDSEAEDEHWCGNRRQELARLLYILQYRGCWLRTKQFGKIRVSADIYGKVLSHRCYRGVASAVHGLKTAKVIK